jgi:3-phosphoshikimate 1-carboxyvinyltransferase
LSTHITLYKKKTFNGLIKNLPASKSISNRALILNAIAGSGSSLSNLSDANDTQLMRKLISSNEQVLDVEDAGTTMRFLTAFNAITNREKIITGTDRMQQRPIAILVDALRKLGAEIEYLEKEGFPPVKTKGFIQQKIHEITIKGDVSSQYISALMMVAPTLPQGLHLTFEGKVTSLPYIEMTAALMRQFGALVELSTKEIIIPNQKYTPTNLTIESDWSAASYWFAFTALAESAEVELPNMTLRSLQGDKVIVDMMELLGVKSEPRGNNLLLIKKEHHPDFSWDFTHCPDLAQTITVICAAKGITGTFTGLESLRIKETDRIKALQIELRKLGTTLIEEDGKWILRPGKIDTTTNLFINTYLDHRMAMAFAPLAATVDVTIEDPNVVRKSYPKFWNDVEALGIKTMLSEVS